jgi:putative ABC transport system permease protein
VRHTLRLLLKSPGFTITAVVVLAFGIGVNTAMFSLIDAVILNVLPYPEPDRLVQIFQPSANNSHAAQVDYPDYVDFTRSQHSFDHLALSNWFFLDYGGQVNPQRFTAVFATPNLVSVTNLPFVLGRPFREEEDKHGGPLVAVLSEGLWRSRFNRDPTMAKVVMRDPEILGGEPVFAGTRVPIKSLFDHLEAGDSIADFLEGFPSVKREQVLALLEESKAHTLAHH